MGRLLAACVGIVTLVATWSCGRTTEDVVVADAGAADSADDADAPEANDAVIPDSPPSEVGDVDAPSPCACGAYEYCHDPSGQCAGSVCAKADWYCGGGDPVCGCDGIQYAGQCYAASQGVDVDKRPDACKPPSSTLITCGASYCQRFEEYCEIMYGDASDAYFNCRPKPTSCATLDCTCAKSAPCSNSGTFKVFACTEDGKGDVLVKCGF